MSKKSKNEQRRIQNNKIMYLTGRVRRAENENTRLRSQNDDFVNGSKQLKEVLDSILIEVALKYGEVNSKGNIKLKIPKPDISKLK